MLYNYKSNNNKRLTFCVAAVGLIWNYFIRSELKLDIPETQKEQTIHREKLAGSTVMVT